MGTFMDIRPGRRINVETYDNSAAKGTIFLIHGMGGNAQQWRQQIKVLQKDYTLIVPDLLGHGKSDQPKPSHNDPYTFLAFIQDLQLLLQKFGGEKNYLIGHSYGGALAVYLAATQADKFQKMVLLAPTICQPTPSVPFLFKMPLFVMNFFLPLLQKQFRNAAFDSSTSLELIAEENKASKNNKLYVIKDMLRGMQNISFIDVSQIKIPTLIIAGETDKIISNVKMIAFYENLPQREFAVVNGAAHMVMLEQPEKVNTLIEKFLVL